MLTGGESSVWAADDIVFKRVTEAEEGGWIAEVLDRLPEKGFRIPRPIAAPDRTWVVEGWSACRFVAGRHDLATRWPDVLAVGERSTES